MIYKFWQIRLLVILGLLLSTYIIIAQDKVILHDNTILKINGYIFDGTFYTVDTISFGKQVYREEEITCIGSRCGGAISFDNAIPVKTKLLEIHGSNTLGAHLMPALLEHYADSVKLSIDRQAGSAKEESTLIFKKAKVEKFRVNIKAHGSGTSFKALAVRDTDIGMSSRSINEEERVNLAKDLGDFKLHISEHMLALDGLAVIIHKSNPINSLSLQNIAKIFSGEINNWGDVEGNSGNINIYAPDNKSGTYDTFNSFVLKPAGVQLNTKTPRFESAAKLSDSIARDPKGIGFVGFPYVRNSKSLSLQGSCGLGFAPNKFSIKTGEYPLARRLFLYTFKNPVNPNVKAIFNSVLSDRAQIVIDRAGFVNQDIILNKNEQNIRMEYYVGKQVEDKQLLKSLRNRIKNAARASVKFQFQLNSSILDNMANQKIDRLVRFLKQRKISNEQIMLLGFADSQGSFKANRILSVERANVVARVLAQEGVEVGLKNINGYSDLAPVACNLGNGLEKNRRVEVWIRNSRNY